jgi:hypothetical protein
MCLSTQSMAEFICLSREAAALSSRRGQVATFGKGGLV